VIITALSLFLLFLLHLDDLSTLVVAAVWTNPVWETHFATIGALNQVLGFQGIV
jgi:hypothetical protein